MNARVRPHSEILNRLSELNMVHPTICWYGFGSFFNSDRSFNDIDLLAVCAQDSDTSSLRSALEDLLVRWPIHLTIMTMDEELETKFVARHGCHPLTSMPSEK